MSAENDVPLGEEARRYYEQQFGERIHQIKKGGSASQREGGGSGWNGRAGCGGILAVVFILRLLLALVRTHSSPPTYQPTPVLPPPEFLNQENPLAAQIQEVNAEAEAALLRESDVPLPEGLSYRIYHESLRPETTPGKHLLALLDPDVRKLLIQSAQGQVLNAKERRDLLDGLNDALQQDNFWDEDAFHQRPPLAELLNQGRIAGRLQGFDDLLATRMKERRLLLERCYPQQIVPLSERLRRDKRTQAEWKSRAQRDLVAARQEHERAKR